MIRTKYPPMRKNKDNEYNDMSRWYPMAFNMAISMSLFWWLWHNICSAKVLCSQDSILKAWKRRFELAASNSFMSIAQSAAWNKALLRASAICNDGWLSSAYQSDSASVFSTGMGGHTNSNV